MKPFVPLVASSQAGWRRLGLSAPEEALPVPAEEMLLAQLAGRRMMAAEPEPEPDVEPEPEPEPEPDPELIARIEELEARDQEREEEHAAAMKSLEAERKSLAQATERVLQVARAVDGARSQLVEELREAVGGVILEAARRMAGQALHADPRLVDAIVEEASRALGREGLVVRVAPQDAELLRGRFQGSGITVVEDPAVDAGAICEGPTGRIDASLASASSAIASVLAQWQAAP